MKIQKILTNLFCMTTALILPACNICFVDGWKVHAEIKSESLEYSGFTYAEIDQDHDGIFDSVKILSGDRSAVLIEIPDQINGLPVTSIGDSAFSGCQTLQEVVLPGNLKEIQEMAFYGCYGLQEIVIPNGVERLENRAFASCLHLKNVTIPESVSYIGSRVFEFTYELKEIFIPDAVTEINDNAFCYCGFETIKIPDGVKRIGDSAFSGCPSLQSVILPDSVTIIGDSAFYGCQKLKEIIFPDDVTEIGSYAFVNTALTEVNIPESVQMIGKNAFSGCTSIVVSEENTVYSTADGVLFNKDKTRLLQYPREKKDFSYTIPDTVREFDNSAFFFPKYSTLKKLTVPESVTAIPCPIEECFDAVNLVILNPFCEIYDAKSKYYPESNNSAVTDRSGNFVPRYLYQYHSTIYGYENSTAQAYAEKYDYKFESLGEYTSPEISTGDANGDSRFDILDLIRLQKWLLGDTAIQFADWKIVDFNQDGMLNIYDFCLMKQILIGIA